MHGQLMLMFVGTGRDGKDFFNEPVDAKALGLKDYHNIILKPMDLGTLLSNLKVNIQAAQG